jgi:predicted porin
MEMDKKLMVLALAGALGLPSQVSADNGNVVLYGHLDVSFDNVDDGVIKKNQVSSNLSYIGLKGSEDLGGDLKALWQVESLIRADIGGPTSTWASRDSFVGLGSSWGAIKLGMSDTPYKKSTARMDLFANSLGDYNAIMGNTGGDNRAEFDWRMPNSVWYESPDVHGFHFSALYSMGELPDRGNVPGTGLCNGATLGSSGSTPDVDPVTGEVACIDGAWNNAWSTALTYDTGPWFAVAAYERHQRVNRNGDDVSGGGGGGPFLGVEDESAWKVGGAYRFASGQINAIYESFRRPGLGNERTRKGWYLSGEYDFDAANDLILAWAHAAKTPESGPDNASGVIPSDNRADLYSIGARHHFSKRTTAYLVFAEVNNKAGGHYALGPGGHGDPVAARSGCSVGDPCGLTGLKPKGASIGFIHNF